MNFDRNNLKTDQADLKDLGLEVKNIVLKEQGELNKFRNCLNDLINHKPELEDKRIIKKVLAEVKESDRQLDYLNQFVNSKSRQKNVSYIFQEIIKLGAYVLKRSVFTRSSLYRHSPTLSGQPVSLDPVQNCSRSDIKHTVDYNRCNYLIFPRPGENPPLEFADLSQNKKIVSKLTKLLYPGESQSIKSLLFCGAMGGITCFFHYLKSLSHGGERKIFLGNKTWLEASTYALESNDKIFQFFDELNTDNIIKAIKDPKVLAVMIEPIPNHPELPAVELNKVFAAMKKLNFPQPKFILVDAAHIPEYNPFKFFKTKLPKNLCLVTAVSTLKFFQAGWDISKGGFLAVQYNEKDFLPAASPYSRLIKIRADSGRGLSNEEANLTYIENSTSFKTRMSRYDRNTKVLAELLDGYLAKNKFVAITSPWLKNHEYYRRAQDNYQTGGRLIYIIIRKKIDLNQIIGFYNQLIGDAVKAGIPLMNASSFGFSCPHAHFVMHPTAGACIRISPGSANLSTILRLAQTMSRTILNNNLFK